MRCRSIRIQKNLHGKAPTTVKVYKREFICYPSPSSDYINIENPIEFSKITISDITGKNLMIINAINNKLTLNISDLEPGIYVVHDNYGNSYKFIKI